MKTKTTATPIFGLLAQFEGPTEVVAAAQAIYEEGYRRIDGYSPYPIEELSHAVGMHRTRLPFIVLIGGVIGCIGGFALQLWCSKYAYPLNIAGKPLNSWPAFIPVTFECTILFSALAAVFGMLALNGLPMPYHPVFNVESFVNHASKDGFFVLIDARDPKFDRRKTAEFLVSLKPIEVSEVEH